MYNNATMDLAHDLRWKSNSKMETFSKIKQYAFNLFRSYKNEITILPNAIGIECRSITDHIAQEKDKLCEMDVYDELSKLKAKIEQQVKQEQSKLPFDVCCIKCNYTDLTILDNDYKEIGSNMIRIVQLECPQCHYKLQISNFR